MSRISELKHILLGALAGAFISWVGIPCFNKLMSKENTSEDISKKYILVLDDFDEKDLHINDDDTCDITHGELVSKIIESELPEYDVDKIDAHVHCTSDSFFKHRLFDRILHGGKKYDAANVSVGAHISFNELSERTGIDVTRENVAEKAKEIKAYLKKHPKDYLMKGNIFLDAEMGGIADFLDGLDSLSAKGTKIYVSTCNEGPRYLNLVSLADGAIVVGAADSLDTKYYSSENSLVRRHFNDTVKITKTQNGYSIDGGKTTAFKNTEVSKGSNKPYPRTYEGASFATPRVLVSDLKLYK